MADPQALASNGQRALELVYPEIWKNHQAIAEFRAKLLALLPTVSGAAIFVLLSRNDKDATQLAAIGLFGFAVTFGLFMYDLRGIQDCVELRKRAGNLEVELGIEREDLTPFRAPWPKPKVLKLADEVGASWIVYTAVLASWIYLAGSGSDIWNDRRSLVLVGLYVLLLLAFVKWFGPSIRGERPAASDPVLALLHDHVAIRVADFDETLRWYSDKLGFHVGPQWSDGELRFAYLISGSTKIEVIGGGRPERLVEAEDLDSSFGVQGYHHFCLAVDELDAVVDELRRRGVTIVRAPFPLSAINRRLAFIKDNSGNMIELSSVADRLRTSS